MIGDDESRPMPLTKESVQVARLEERMSNISVDVAELTRAIKELGDKLGEVQKTIDAQKANWKLLMTLGALVGTAGSAIVNMATHLKWTP